MSQTLAKLKFLIVEDNAFMRDLIKKILRGLGVGDIKTAEDGKEAKDVLDTFDPDIAIVDLQMPKINGLQFTKLVRSGEFGSNKELPIIILTAHAEEPLVKRSREAGADLFVIKPVSPASLKQRIETVLAQRAAAAENG